MNPQQSQLEHLRLKIQITELIKYRLIDILDELFRLWLSINLDLFFTISIKNISLKDIEMLKTFYFRYDDNATFKIMTLLYYEYIKEELKGE